MRNLRVSNRTALGHQELAPPLVEWRAMGYNSSVCVLHPCAISWGAVSPKCTMNRAGGRLCWRLPMVEQFDPDHAYRDQF